MNFEELKKTWRAQGAGPQISINADLLLKEVRRNERSFLTTILWRDVREVGVAFLLTWYFTQRGLRNDAWTDCLVGLACFGVGAFMLVDRLLQRRKKPVASDSLVACIEVSLGEVNHQIWLLKNVFWWYLLPLAIALGISVLVSSWHSGLHTSQVTGLCAYLLICVLVNWFVHWLNQTA